MKYQAVVIGCSMGGLRVLSLILGRLPHDFPLPIVVLNHLNSDSESLLPEILNRETSLHVEQARPDSKLTAGHVYVAPPAYHIYLEHDFSFTFSLDPKVSYSRPSIDVLFESMGDVFGPQLIAVLLTGANSDGALGLKHIREMGGFVIVQNPTEAEASVMPEAALEIAGADKVLDEIDIADYLVMLSQKRIYPEEL